MSDEQMDARLRSAGERWRTGTAVAEPAAGEPIEPIPPTPSRSHRTLAMLSAAVVVAALAIGAVLFAVDRGSDAPSAGTAVDPTRPLEGVTWTDARSRATVVFLPGAARIFDGCSGEQRALITHGHVIRLGKPIGITSVCSELPLGPPGTEQGSEPFWRVLERGPFTWSLSGRTLRASANGLTITLTTSGVRAPAIKAQTWVLARFNDPSGNTHRATVHAKLTFDAAHGFTASDTCNQLSGTVHRTLASITFSGVTMTERFCALSADSAIPVSDKLLRGTTRYEIRGDELILSRPHYAGSLVYRAK
jgi:heat shock protein HslJ